MQRVRGHSGTKQNGIAPSHQKSKATESTQLYRTTPLIAVSERHSRTRPRSIIHSTPQSKKGEYSGVERAVSERVQRYQTPRHRAFSSTAKREGVYSSIGRQSVGGERAQRHQTPRHRTLTSTVGSQREHTAVSSNSLICSE